MSWFAPDWKQRALDEELAAIRERRDERLKPRIEITADRILVDEVEILIDARRAHIEPLPDGRLRIDIALHRRL